LLEVVVAVGTSVVAVVLVGLELATAYLSFLPITP
jgi:hypothetical protein